MPRLLISFLCFFYISSAWAEIIMWLPASYQKKDRELSRAVDIVERTERCHKPLKATISVDRSTLDHPVYKVLCRDKELVTYYELVDGVDFKIIEVNLPGDTKTSSSSGISEARLKNMWRTCQAMLREEQRNFPEVKMITQGRPTETKDKYKTVRFNVDFDAVSIFGKNLRYRAVCRFKTDLDYDIRLRPRPKD